MLYFILACVPLSQSESKDSSDPVEDLLLPAMRGVLYNLAVPIPILLGHSLLYKLQQRDTLLQLF